MDEYKVIGVDNFDRDWISDTLVEENLSKEAAEKIAQDRNYREGKHGTRYFKAVPQDHKLYTWEP